MSENQKDKQFEYTITLNSRQAREVQNALEAIMRWMLKQPQIMEEYLPDRLDWHDDFDVSLAKRNGARELLRAANDLLVPYDQMDWKDKPLKNDQWYRIYNIYQVVRHAIWEAEKDHEYYTVDSQTPFNAGGIDGLPKIEWRKKE